MQQDEFVIDLFARVRRARNPAVLMALYKGRVVHVIRAHAEHNGSVRHAVDRLAGRSNGQLKLTGGTVLDEVCVCRLARLAGRREVEGLRRPAPASRRRRPLPSAVANARANSGLAMSSARQVTARVRRELLPLSMRWGTLVRAPGTPTAASCRQALAYAPERFDGPRRWPCNSARKTPERAFGLSPLRSLVICRLPDQRRSPSRLGPARSHAVHSHARDRQSVCMICVARQRGACTPSRNPGRVQHLRRAGAASPLWRVTDPGRRNGDLPELCV
jgi:hypothetical protein